MSITRSEILLTLAQSLLAMMVLANMRSHWHEALVLFVLWLLQFVFSNVCEEVAGMYLIWSGVEIFKLLHAEG